MGIAPIGLVLSKIAVMVAFFFEEVPAGRTNRMEKTYQLPISPTLFRTPDGFGSRKHSSAARQRIVALLREIAGEE